LVVVGDGDPYIVSEKLWQLAADLDHLGIKEVEGNIVIDGRLFDGDGRDASRKSGTVHSANAYDAPVSAFGVNFNTLAVAVAPGERQGAPALANLDPVPIDGVTIRNHLKTVDGSRSSYKVERTSKGPVTLLDLAGTVGRGNDL